MPISLVRSSGGGTEIEPGVIKVGTTVTINHKGYMKRYGSGYEYFDGDAGSMGRTLSAKANAIANKVRVIALIPGSKSPMNGYKFNIYNPSGYSPRGTVQQTVSPFAQNNQHEYLEYEVIMIIEVSE